MNRKYRTLEDRLIANTIIEHSCFIVIDGEKSYCWLWIGARNSRGYGKLDVRSDGKRVTWLAHRLAFSVFKGIRLFKSLVIRHACDKQLCINPAHLNQGTQTTNIRDCVDKGRHVSGFKCSSGIYNKL